MDKFIVSKSKLSGTVRVGGSKNAALPIMAATLLSEEKCVIKNVPSLKDITTMIKILEVLGKKISFQANTLIVESKTKRRYVAPYRLVKTMRASFCCLGPLLAKRKKAKVALPGGCVIGPRPVDLHIKGLAHLGADISIERGYCQARVDNLKGNHIYLGGPFGSSVLATANVMMAAVLAKGNTLIEHAACEPEISALGQFLKKMGADICGFGTPLIRVKGKSSLGGCEFKVIPDRIEAGTFIAASLATGSGLEIKEAEPAHLTSVFETAKKIGAKITVKNKTKSIKVKAPGKLKAVNVTTLPYPGFPTDLQAQFMVCLAKAKGISLVHEKIYPDRFMHVAELNRMGASIQKLGPYAIIEGRKKIQGAEVQASDLRASAALVIAGLAGEGSSKISRIYHIDRGYENIEEKLQKLGANIKRVR
ncbi:MAG: UDP-N-acetylglucosamine 1-carboxyvinyltransferase [Candidatus Omnitrophica bacterium]|nr:UDP-N-acetylglucosamine 1-carboxyvinyltransferase [Candidatus Omnitrophota bacterium]MCF7878699.1 UDP-N-acetylglucosamine 1-carboxyvinyltransferase [Candidatus Omnitrophota bacterium]MCF7892962.1 UDP-N-acetylglucosamine 1-carboxyvinyltransferase [Candidatus Omnitrophota bacterium]